MSAQAAPTDHWSIDSWSAFWSNPSATTAAERVRRVVVSEVAGYWPRAAEPVRGVEQYAQRVVDLLTLVPDLRLQLVEHATNGEVVFVRWDGRGTGPDGPFEARGADRLIVDNGKVRENMILSDHPIFAALARYASERATNG